MCSPVNIAPEKSLQLIWWNSWKKQEFLDDSKEFLRFELCTLLYVQELSG